MTDSGRATRAAMESVINDLSDYESAIGDELDQMIKKICDLSNIWDDENFSLLLASVENIKLRVKDELSTVRNARHALEAKVRIFDGC